jgi:hypothetical protein
MSEMDLGDYLSWVPEQRNVLSVSYHPWMYRIAWRNRTTGELGHGTAFARTESECALECAFANSTFRDTEHWIERVPAAMATPAAAEARSE